MPVHFIDLSEEEDFEDNIGLFYKPSSGAKGSGKELYDKFAEFISNKCQNTNPAVFCYSAANSTQTDQLLGLKAMTGGAGMANVAEYFHNNRLREKEPSLPTVVPLITQGSSDLTVIRDLERYAYLLGAGFNLFLLKNTQPARDKDKKNTDNKYWGEREFAAGGATNNEIQIIVFNKELLKQLGLEGKFNRAKADCASMPKGDSEYTRYDVISYGLSLLRDNESDYANWPGFLKRAYQEGQKDKSDLILSTKKAKQQDHILSNLAEKYPKPSKQLGADNFLPEHVKSVKALGQCILNNLSSGGEKSAKAISVKDQLEKLNENSNDSALKEAFIEMLSEAAKPRKINRFFGIGKAQDYGTNSFKAAVKYIYEHKDDFKFIENFKFDAETSSVMKENIQKLLKEAPEEKLVEFASSPIKPNTE